MAKTKIIYRKRTDLVPYERNPRKNERAVEKVKTSIEKFGFLVPILIDPENEIVAGHTRGSGLRRVSWWPCNLPRIVPVRNAGRPS